MDLSPVSWAEGAWTTPPAAVAEDGTDLLVTCVEGSDAWRTTSYGFIHDTEHALVAPLPSDSAMEVVFTADYAEQFDQAGIFVVAAQDRWIKAGVEAAAGPLACAPTRAGLTVRFHGWWRGPADGSLH